VPYVAFLVQWLARVLKNQLNKCSYNLPPIYGYPYVIYDLYYYYYLNTHFQELKCPKLEYFIC
jgi:hypothetical protein